MRRHLSEPRLVIASHNAGKVREIGVLLARFAVEVVSAAELGLPEPDETGLSFEANAELKAVAAARASALPALADDSGLVVPALGGAPGIYSARWAGADKDFGRAMRRLEAELTGVSDRRAHFVAVLALAWPDGHVESFRGEAHGRLVWPPRGTRGFGYDPIFIHDGQTLSYGELEPDDKHRMSHRAIAFEKLLASCLR